MGILKKCKNASTAFKQNASKVAAAGLGLVVIGGTNAQAALVDTDVSMDAAKGDVTTVVIAIIGLLVVVFGFRKVLGLLGR